MYLNVCSRVRARRSQDQGRAIAQELAVAAHCNCVMSSRLPRPLRPRPRLRRPPLTPGAPGAPQPPPHSTPLITLVSERPRTRNVLFLNFVRTRWPYCYLWSEYFLRPRLLFRLSFFLWLVIRSVKHYRKSL